MVNQLVTLISFSFLWSLMKNLSVRSLMYLKDVLLLVVLFGSGVFPAVHLQLQFPLLKSPLTCLLLTAERSEPCFPMPKVK